MIVSHAISKLSIIQVTRRINAEVQEGLSQIRMTNLSKSIDPSTIRVLIGGNSILNEVNFITKSVLDEYAEAGEQLDELKVKQAELLKVNIYTIRLTALYYSIKSD